LSRFSPRFQAAEGSPKPPQIKGLPFPRVLSQIRPATIAGTAADVDWQTDEQNPLRQFGLWAALIFVFLRFSLLHEILAATYGLNVYALLVVAIPAVMAALFSGGWRRIKTFKLVWIWAAFGLWLFATVPFSFWKGESLFEVFSYWRVNLASILIVAGLTLTLRECFLMVNAIGIGAIINILAGRIFGGGDATRVSVGFGNIGNANDYAAHLLMVLPFLACFLLTVHPKALRFALFPIVLYGILIGAGAGSRGGLIGLAAVLVFAFMRGPARLRSALVIIVPLFALLLSFFLSDYAKMRYASIFGDPDQQSEEIRDATSSREARSYLLQESLRLSLEHPIVGVGVGQFGNYLGTSAQERGEHGTFQVTHNAYTEVSSETGIVGFLLFVAAIVSTFVMLNQLYGVARQYPGLEQVGTAAFCMMIAIVGFCTAIFFLSLAFSVYLPIVSGLAIAFTRAVNQELKVRSAPVFAAMRPIGSPSPVVARSRVL
jgi:O-antigen ligase